MLIRAGREASAKIPLWAPFTEKLSLSMSQLTR